MTLGRFVGHISERAISHALDNLPSRTPLGCVVLKLDSSVHRVRLIAHIKGKRYYAQVEFTEMMARAAQNKSVALTMGQELGTKLIKEVLLS